MSPESDRIAVPTNGRRPHPVPASTEAPSAGGAVATRPASGGPAAPAVPLVDGAPTVEGGSAAPFSPQQLAVGAGVVASLLLLVAGALRRRRTGG